MREAPFVLGSVASERRLVGLTSSGAMDWLFVVGIALDIAGGALLAGPTVLVGRKEIARRGVLFPSGGPTLDKARELALSRVGLGLLATGFLLQLGGYVVSSGDAWFLVVALAVILGAGAGGWFLADRVAAARIHASEGRLRRDGA